MPQKKNAKKTSKRQVNKSHVITRQTTKRKRAIKRKQVTKIRRSSYSINQKKEVVAYAKQHGRNKAAKHFELNGSMVGRWMKANTSWTTEMKSHSLRIGSGRKAFYPEAEKKLYDWVIGQRKQGLAVTSATIKVAMFNILEEPDIIALYGDTTETFKASRNWLNRFMKRYKLSLRRRTKVSQKLPRQTQELLENFYQFITRLKIEKSIESCNIFNMDETPVWFDMAGNFTINPKGDKTVHIRGTGNEKNRFTVVLTCAASKFV